MEGEEVKPGEAAGVEEEHVEGVKAGEATEVEEEEVEGV